MRVRISLLLLALLLAGCAFGGGGGRTGLVEWRGLELTLPDGWTSEEQRADLLTASTGRLGEELASPEVRLRDVEPDSNDVVALQATHEPGAGADDWRALVVSEGGTVESEQATQVGGLPATQLVFAWASNGVPTRERVVLVPSRELVLLFQPVPVQGQTTGPQVYLDHTEEFDAILASIRFGAPVDG